MTHYINELADMVPQCAALGRKPDKLTVLRMAVSHMKSIRSTVTCSSAANGFLFVVACDTGKMLYVADSVFPILNLTECMNQTIFDLVHPEDVEKVKEQLSPYDLTMSSSVLDFKSTSMGRVHTSSRRGFICRMKIGLNHGSVNHLSRLRNRRPIFHHGGNHYVIIHCTGYTKNCPQQRCLICIGRLQVSSMPTCHEFSNSSQEFSTRFNQDGEFTFVDHKISSTLGYRPQELLGQFWWRNVHPEDQNAVREAFHRGTCLTSFQNFYTIREDIGGWGGAIECRPV
ncbi:unnamed protein product [Soboliphyme baturini]|uniref:Aryl hydrocarbon receptor nuclear translocator-like protein 1 n=1 Tax=Soboliphyme baturini TaxID=241478 RepID=A0A183IM62_9BILA|nr:unnamed protein product [Soboliphyme baturini]